LPVFAVLFGEVIGVSTVKKLVIVSTYHESNQKKKASELFTKDTQFVTHCKFCTEELKIPQV
jgi:hypothetical protein